MRDGIATEMQVGIVTGPGSTCVASRPVPIPAPGEVLVRLEGCGICGSNLPIWEGREWFEYPREAGSPGHEGWGVVAATGADVVDIQPGDRVAMLSNCAFAEYDVADQAAVVRLPEWLDGRAFPGEPLGCAMNVYRRSDIRQGQTVAVVGAGFLGTLLIQLASSAGARVIAISKRPSSLDIARANGAEETISIGDHYTAIDHVRELTEGAFCDRVIEAVGLQGALDVAGEITGERGRLVIAGFHQDGLRKVNLQLWNWRGLDVINAHERDPAAYTRGIRDAVDAVHEGRLDPFPLFTHSIRLDGLGDALNLLVDRPDGFVKALITTDA